MGGFWLKSLQILTTLKNRSYVGVSKTIIMKNVITFIFFFSFITSVVSQLQPILPYKNEGYTKSEINDFALGGSTKSTLFRKKVVEQVALLMNDSLPINGSNVKWIFRFLYSEEVSLKKGTYQNSGWDEKNQKIEYFPGKDWEGFCWVFRCGTYEKVLLKGNCANVLDVPAVRLTFATPAPKPDTIRIRDTVLVEIPPDWEEYDEVEGVTVFICRGYFYSLQPVSCNIQGSYVTLGAYFTLGAYGGYTCGIEYPRYCPPVIRDCWNERKHPVCDPHSGKWSRHDSNDRYYGSRQTGKSALADNSSARQSQTRPESRTRDLAPRQKNRGTIPKANPAPRQKENTAMFQPNRQRNNGSATSPRIDNNRSNPFAGNRTMSATPSQRQAQARVPQASARPPQNRRGRN